MRGLVTNQASIIDRLASKLTKEKRDICVIFAHRLLAIIESMARCCTTLNVEIAN